ncbi:MAG: tyrosine-type recombinase/integrase [Caldilineaceae bacterium]|nr:tyrosine-type recombinase/integrase [Caldilineaceae bacterium]
MAKSISTMGKTRYAGIYRRPGGKYLARIRNRYGNVSKAFTDLDGAYRWRRDAMSDLENGRAVVLEGEVVGVEEAERRQRQGQGRTLKDLIKRFKQTGECRVPQPHLDQYEDTLGDLSVDEITRADVQDLLDKHTTGRAPATFNRYRAGVHRLMNFARELDWVRDNVVTGIKRKREDNRRDRLISPDEEKALLKACEAHDPQGRLATIFSLLMATGCRVGELQGLTWGALDLKAGTARLGWGTTKNGHARTLVIRGAALARLKQYAKIQPLSKNELVFIHDTGNRPYDATKEFRVVADGLSLTDVVLHNARHTFATRLARVPGMTLVMLRDALGHKSLAMVQRYAHEMTDDLAAKIEEMLS